MSNRLLWAAFAALAFAGSARAEVQETRDNGFVIEATVMAEASPLAVYRKLVNVAGWWDPAHTWSGSARNLKLSPKAGGCFCERLADGGSVQHGRVIFAQPGRLLRLEAALGPLQDMAVTGVLSFTLAPDGPGTRIKMTYRVAGALTMDSAKLAPLVDQVMGIQLGRLRSFSSGAPAGP
ncbi:MAG TPA: hypothetical protein VFU13_02520 [Steroidobacteraceae bacterium]|nr:hypothetical protein [Steroidobacteraceae bacterium]